MQDTLQADPLEIEEISGAQPATEPPSAELLQAKLHALHALRVEQGNVNKQIDALLVRFRKINQSLFDRESDISDQLKQAEADARNVAVELFALDGNKQVAAGVTIRETTNYIYPADEALDWARDHHMALIPESLDAKAFKDVCKAESMRPSFVSVTKSASAAIATDLSKVFDEASK